MLIEKPHQPKIKIDIKRTLKKCLKRVIITFNILIILLIISISALHYSSPIVQQKVDSQLITPLKYFFLPRDYHISFKSLWDICKYSLLGKIYNADVEIITINANFKNANKFFDQLENRETNNTKSYSKGKLLSKEGIYSIKFRPKGDREIHYRKRKPSFAIKVRDGKAFNGMKEFSLQHPLIRNYLSEYLWLLMLNENGIITPNYFFVQLIFNGDDLGIYSYEEKPSTFMLERLGLRNSSIIKFDETFGDNLNSNPEIVVINDADATIQNQELAVSLLRGFINGSSCVKETFDLEKLAVFFAITDLCQTHHGIDSKSVRFYYNPYSNLLEPIPFDGHASTLNEALHGRYITSELAFENTTYLMENIDWFKLFFNRGNKEFVDLYYKKLKIFTSETYINGVIADATLGKKMETAKRIIYMDFPFEDRVLYEGPFPYYFDYKTFMVREAKVIRDKLLQNSNFQFYANINSSPISIEVFNFSSTKYPIKITNIQSENLLLELNEDVYFWENDTIGHSVKINILNDSLKADCQSYKKLKISYLTTGGQKFTKNINLFSHKFMSGGFNNQYLNQLLLAGELQKEDSVYSFKSKLLIIDSILVIPKFTKLVISSGQQIIFKKNSGIISYGNLEFNGERDSLIIISYEDASSPNNYGGFILGIGAASFKIDGVLFKNLTSPNRLDLTGAITFYNSSVSISNTTFLNNFSEDYLNLVNCTFEMSKVRFVNCQSDCIDSDFSNGKMKSVLFSNSGNDGLDISGSVIEADNLLFNLIGDKAISAGEQSQLKIDNVKIDSSEIGLACKDGSMIHGSNINLNNVRVPIALFIKKLRFDNPQITLFNYDSKNYETQYLIGESLVLKIDSTVVVGQIKNVEDLLYGNSFGVKSIR